MEKQDATVLLNDVQDVLMPMSRTSLLMRYQYIKHVIDNGHVPGVLSGAELRDIPAEDRAHYARCRQRAVALMLPFGVRVGVARVDGHVAVVWTDAAGNRVRVRISST